MAISPDADRGAEPRRRRRRDRRTGNRSRTRRGPRSGDVPPVPRDARATCWCGSAAPRRRTGPTRRRCTRRRTRRNASSCCVAVRSCADGNRAAPGRRAAQDCGTATVRGGTEIESPDTDVRRTTGSAPARWTGCRVSPADSSTGTRLPPRRGVEHRDDPPAQRIQFVADGVVQDHRDHAGRLVPAGRRNETRSAITSAEPSRNSGDENRMRSRSSAAARAPAMSAAPGTRARSATRPRWPGQAVVGGGRQAGSEGAAGAGPVDPVEPVAGVERVAVQRLRPQQVGAGVPEHRSLPQCDGRQAQRVHPDPVGHRRGRREFQRQRVEQRLVVVRVHCSCCRRPSRWPGCRHARPGAPCQQPGTARRPGG